MYYILYPPGSHGNFLKLLLNSLVGNQINNIESAVYDNVVYHNPCLFETAFTLKDNIVFSNCINIQINSNSYLKYFAMCFNRVSDHDMLIENLSIDTFEKIKKHSIISFFSDSLSRVSGNDHGDVEPKFLREWMRLCFFENNGETITKFISPSTCMYSKYTVDFESFYDGTILDQCKKICFDLGLKIDQNKKFHNLLNHFIENNRYYSIDQTIPNILSAIDQHQCVDLTHTNILQQAWIDNYLATNYNVNPYCKNEYFVDTKELVEAYQI